MSDPKRRKIIVDDKIPYLSGCLEPFFDLAYLPAREFSSESVADADALIVRTTVRCNKALLDHSDVLMIATATIGFDHIDTLYCKHQGIEWRNAPGCNAGSVAHYFAASLALLRHQGKWDYQGRTLGIVGLGHVGHQVAETALALGMQVLAYDPFLHQWLTDRAAARKTAIRPVASLEVLAEEADIISFHTPLTRAGESAFPTFHIADGTFFNSLRRSPLIINSARGGVVCEEALLEALEQGKASGALIDCWENEPHIDLRLLQKSLIATPHIAGYSADGKWNGTRLTLRSISHYFNLPIVPLPTPKPKPIAPVIDLHAVAPDRQVDHALLATYPYLTDEINDLRRNSSGFHTYRDHYRLRREPSAYTVRGADPMQIKTLERLGFECRRDEIEVAPTRKR